MFTLRFSALLGCCLLTYTSFSFAAIEPLAGKADEILITASRTPLTLIHAGNATTVITRAQIEQQQVRYVTDLLRAVPGFSVSQSGPRGSQTQVRVRGAEGNHVLVLIDGVRANDPANSDEFRWELLSAYDIENIEIIRGPQSALWGSDALAAVVSISTRSDRRGTGFNAFAEGGTESTINSGVSGGTATDTWSVNYGLARLDTDGTNVSRAGNEDEASDLTTASLNGRLQATDKLGLDFGLRLVDSTSEFDPIGFDGIPTDGDQESDSTQRYVQAGGELSTFNGKLIHHLDVRRLDTSRDDMTDGVQISSSDADRTTVAYQANLPLGRNALALAAEHERTTFEQRGEASFFGDPNQDQAMTVSSLIADFQWQVADNVTLLLSARHDDYSDFDDATTGRVSLSYRLSDTTKLRGSLGTGQKVPTFTERFGFFPDQFIGNPNLEPEKSTAFDLGIEQLFMNDRLELEATYFHQDLEDEINGFAFVPGLASPTAVNTPGDSKRRGVELESTWNASTRLELGAAYTYTDSSAEDSQGADVREIRRPRHTGSLWTSWRFADERANLYLAADYNGSNTDTVFLPPLFSPEFVQLDSYWLVSLTTGYDVTDNLNLFVRINNLLNEDYEDIFGFNTPRRSAYAGIRLNFGE